MLVEPELAGGRKTALARGLALTVFFAAGLRVAVLVLRVAMRVTPRLSREAAER